GCRELPPLPKNRCSQENLLPDQPDGDHLLPAESGCYSSSETRYLLQNLGHCLLEHLSRRLRKTLLHHRCVRKSSRDYGAAGGIFSDHKPLQILRCPEPDRPLLHADENSRWYWR